MVLQLIKDDFADHIGGISCCSKHKLEHTNRLTPTYLRPTFLNLEKMKTTMTLIEVMLKKCQIVN